MLKEWLIWGSVLSVLLVVDFVMMANRNVTVKRSLWMTAFYVAVSMAFGGYIYYDMGLVAASQYLTVYGLEKMLSVDNLLVISLLFGYFGITANKQHTALIYGIVGAIVMRSVFIMSGELIIEKFQWALYGFAAFLIYTGTNIMTTEGDAFDPSERKLVRWLDKHLVSCFVAAVVAVELSDVMFAVDSIPASFSVSSDKFIILAANIFAVLGLRSLYHAMQHGLKLFEGMEKYIGFVLVFLGVEVFVGHLYEPIASWKTMFIVFTILALGAWNNRPKKVTQKR